MGSSISSMLVCASLRPEIRLEIDRFGVGLLVGSESSWPTPSDDLELLFLTTGDEGARLMLAELDGRRIGAFCRRGEGGFENAADCDTRRDAGLDMLGFVGCGDLPTGTSFVVATDSGCEGCDRLELSSAIPAGGGLGESTRASKGGHGSMVSEGV